MLVCRLYDLHGCEWGRGHAFDCELPGRQLEKGKRPDQFSHERKIHWSIWKGKISQGLTPPRSCSDIRRHSQGWP